MNQRDLALSYGYLGDIYLQLGNAEPAEVEYDESLRIRKALFEANPADPEHRFQYARGLANYASVEKAKRHDIAQAIERLEAARTLQEGLESDFPNIPEFKSDCAWTLLQLTEMNLFMSTRASKNEERITSLKLAEGFAVDALTKFKSLRVENPIVVRGRASCNALLAEALQSLDSDEFAAYALEAESELNGIDRKLMTHEEFFLLGVVRALLQKPVEAKVAIRIAIEKGSTSYARFGYHSQLVFSALPPDAAFEELVKSFVARAAD